MRTLHADLTATQKLASATPYIKLELDSRDRVTSETYETTDKSNRILSVQQADGRTGGFIFDVSEQYYISAVVELQNQDGSLSSKDYRGYRLKINWGYNAFGTNRVAPKAAPYIVVQQRQLSQEGQAVLELRAISLWELARLYPVNALGDAMIGWNTGAADDVAEAVQILQTSLGGALPLSLQRDVDVFAAGGITSFDVVVTIRNTNRGNYNFAEQVLPNVPNVNDAVYLGLDTTFDNVSWHVRVAANNITLAWEYWNGSWTSLTGITDNTNSLQTTGFHTVKFDEPTDWTATSIGDSEEYFFIRGRVTVAGGGQTGPTSGLVYLGHDFGFTLDTDDANQAEDNKPVIITDTHTSAAQVAETALRATRLGLYVRDDGFHAKYIDSTQDPEDYAYALDGAHEFYVHTETVPALIPNRILAVSSDPITGANPKWSGAASDDTSVSKLGAITKVVIDESIVDDADAAAKAQIVIDNLNANLASGEAEVPIHVGQEPWDLVEVSDARTGRTIEGRVTQLVMQYQPGMYRLRLILGGSNKAVVSVPTSALGYTLPVVVNEPQEVLLPAYARPWLGTSFRFAVTNTDTAIQAAIDEVEAAGGGTIILPNATYNISTTLTLDANVPIRIIGCGSILSGQTGVNHIVHVDRVNGNTSHYCVIEDLIIDGNDVAGSEGLRITDTDRVVLKNVRIIDCITGLDLYAGANAGSGTSWIEECSFEDVFIGGCTTGIHFNRGAQGDYTSFFENHFRNVGVNDCTTGILIDRWANLTRCKFDNVVVWLGDNQTGWDIRGDMKEVIADLHIEDQGTPTNVIGITIGANAVNMVRWSPHFSFVGSFIDSVSNETTKIIDASTLLYPALMHLDVLGWTSLIAAAINVSGAGGDDYGYWLFASTGFSGITGLVRVPDDFAEDGGAIALLMAWTSDDANAAHKVRWSVRITSLTPGTDAMNVGVGAVGTAGEQQDFSDLVPGTALDLKQTYYYMTSLTGIARGDWLRINILRNGNFVESIDGVTLDDDASEAHLVGLSLAYKRNI